MTPHPLIEKLTDADIQIGLKAAIDAESEPLTRFFLGIGADASSLLDYAAGKIGQAHQRKKIVLSLLHSGPDILKHPHFLRIAIGYKDLEAVRKLATLPEVLKKQRKELVDEDWEALLYGEQYDSLLQIFPPSEFNGDPKIGKTFSLCIYNFSLNMTKFLFTHYPLSISQKDLNTSLEILLDNWEPYIPSRARFLVKKGAVSTDYNLILRNGGSCASIFIKAGVTFPLKDLIQGCLEDRPPFGLTKFLVENGLPLDQLEAAFKTIDSDVHQKQRNILLNEFIAKQMHAEIKITDQKRRKRF